MCADLEYMRRPAAAKDGSMLEIHWRCNCQLPVLSAWMKFFSKHTMSMYWSQILAVCRWVIFICFLSSLSANLDRRFLLKEFQVTCIQSTDHQITTRLCQGHLWDWLLMLVKGCWMTRAQEFQGPHSSLTTLDAESWECCYPMEVDTAKFWGHLMDWLLMQLEGCLMLLVQQFHESFISCWQILILQSCAVIWRTDCWCVLKAAWRCWLRGFVTL